MIWDYNVNKITNTNYIVLKRTEEEFQMTELEALKSNLNYFIHYVFDENDKLDYVFISHSESVFNQDVQILELTFDQFDKFPLNLDCYVGWGNDTRTPSQWIETWTEYNRI